MSGSEQDGWGSEPEASQQPSIAGFGRLASPDLTSSDKEEEHNSPTAPRSSDGSVSAAPPWPTAEAGSAGLTEGRPYLSSMKGPPLAIWSKPILDLFQERRASLGLDRKLQFMSLCTGVWSEGIVAKARPLHLTTHRLSYILILLGV